jgi:dolichol-phosphate mannosyltransferase
MPLHIITVLGIIFLIASFVLGIQTLYLKLNGEALSGFSTVILLLLIIGSAIMISLGIIGTYIAKIFDEVKNRPRYLVAEKRESGDVIGRKTT